MIWLLLVMFQLKHFGADYLLQTQYMLGKFNAKEWVMPLLAHVAVHGFYTLLVCLIIKPELCWLAVVDMIIHFIVDRVKGVYSRELSIRQSSFWTLLGADQMAHHLTHYFIIFMLIRN